VLVARFFGRQVADIAETGPPVFDEINGGTRCPTEQVTSMFDHAQLIDIGPSVDGGMLNPGSIRECPCFIADLTVELTSRG
jgi:hypothetical protein